MNLIVKNSGAPLGHKIVGINVCQLSDSQFEELNELYSRYGVIVIPGQSLTPDDQIRFSRRFGEIESFTVGAFNLPTHPEIFVVSNIIENGRPIGMSDAGQFWHTDTCFKTVPARGSILYAIEVPRRNGVPLGDTLFASTAAAYDALSQETQSKLQGLQAVHSFANRISAAQTKNQSGTLDPQVAEHLREQREKAMALHPDVVHPLVRNHPVTGRKSIYLSDLLTCSIVGMEPSEGKKLLADLLTHCTRAEFVYRHRWSEGDLVLWDNCSTIHNAIPDYVLPERRLMHRTTLTGTAPV